MKKLIYLLLAVLFVYNCTVDSTQESIQQEEALTLSRASKADKKNKNKITICHKTGNDFINIEVNANALNAHLAHGDINPDADADGFTAPFGDMNPCGYGDGNDCDDTNADCHPDAEEIYTDDIDNNCNGVVGTIDIIEDYMPCTDCTDGTFGEFRNPRNGRCSTIKRRNYYRCMGTYEIYID